SSEETSGEPLTPESDEGTDPSLPPSRPARGRKRRAAAAPSSSEDDDAVPKRRSTRRTRSTAVKAEASRGGGGAVSSSSSELDSAEGTKRGGRTTSRKKGSRSSPSAAAAAVSNMPSPAQKLAERTTIEGRERAVLEMLAALLPPTLAHELYKTLSIWLAGGFEVSTVTSFLERILGHLRGCATAPASTDDDEEEEEESGSNVEAQRKHDAIFDIYTDQERTVLLNRLRELDHAVVEVCNKHIVDLINGALLKREAAKQRKVMKEAPKADGCRSYLSHLSFPGESAEAAVCKERLLRTPPGIINNTWMGVSLGTEEAQDFKYFRRNHSEEALFNNEDHKYATTFTVKCVSLTVHRLERLLKKLEGMPEEQREAYKLSMPQDITSQHLEQIINSYTSTAIGQKMAEEVLAHPMKTLPLLLTRLKDTEASLMSPSSGLIAAASKAWLKVDKRSFLPGLDHRSYYF
ncbi:Transcriptional regulatory protein sin3, partial [Perkinsus olseni]